MMTTWLETFAETSWKGKGELWLDPAGNRAETYVCALHFKKHEVVYSWIYEQETKHGRFTFHDAGAEWVDSWHQPCPIPCADVPNEWGIFTVRAEYSVEGSPNWAWKSKLSQRPDHSLVLQMTNIAPWGEEGRAVRMVFERDPG